MNNNIFRLFVNSWGNLKMEEDRRLCRLIFVVVKGMEYPVYEPFKISVAVSVSFKRLDFVIAALGKSESFGFFKKF